MIHINYHFHPFKVDIAVIFADSVPEGLTYMIEKCGAKIDISPNDEKLTSGIVGHGLDSEGLNAWYMVINENEFNIGILAHECLHAINFITLSKGMKYSEDAEELYAYAIEEMMNTILNEYCEKIGSKMFEIR